MSREYWGIVSLFEEKFWIFYNEYVFGFGSNFSWQSLYHSLEFFIKALICHLALIKILVSTTCYGLRLVNQSKNFANCTKLVYLLNSNSLLTVNFFLPFPRIKIFMRPLICQLALVKTRSMIVSDKRQLAAANDRQGIPWNFSQR